MGVGEMAKGGVRGRETEASHPGSPREQDLSKGNRRAFAVDAVVTRSGLCGDQTSQKISPWAEATGS
jgi:hypothetical protein